MQDTIGVSNSGFLIQMSANQIWLSKSQVMTGGLTTEDPSLATGDLGGPKSPVTSDSWLLSRESRVIHDFQSCIRLADLTHGSWI